MDRRDRMQTDVASTRLTYGDYVLFPDDGRRHELIDGKDYVTPSPNTRHQRVLRRLAHAIEHWLVVHPVGEMFFAPFDVVLSEHDVVVPDLVYISAATAAHLDERGLFAAPDLAVEILSPSTRRRDDGLKRRLYERVAMKEYWIVDPRANTVRVFRLDAGRFGPGVTFSREQRDIVTTPLLTGLEISLEAVLA
jgi:Uma2 family endonuclease